MWRWKRSHHPGQRGHDHHHDRTAGRNHDHHADIGIFEEFEEVGAGGIRWVDLPLHEQMLTLQLMYSIGYCSLQTQGELMFRPEVQDFLEGSPFA
jgi:hypothetical protein